MGKTKRTTSLFCNHQKCNGFYFYRQPPLSQVTHLPSSKLIYFMGISKQEWKSNHHHCLTGFQGITGKMGPTSQEHGCDDWKHEKGLVAVQNKRGVGRGR